MVKPVFRQGEVSRLFYEALGGPNSPLREMTQAQLGHPALISESIYVPDDLKEYDGQVWLHELSGDFPLPDSSDTERTDYPPAVFTGYLAPEKLLSGRRKYGTTVRIQWIHGRYEVQGVAGPAAEDYLRGAPELDWIVISRAQLSWGLLHPTDPPSAAVVLAGGAFRDGDTWYLDADYVTVDLIATYGSSLTPGQAVAVQIEQDVSDGSITYTAGSAFTDTSRDSETGAVDHSQVFANYPTGTSDTLRHYGWVKLYYQMQVITEQDILVAPDESAGGAGGAPSDATYITQTANGTLSAEQALSSLATGAMIVTNGTGVVTSLKHNLSASTAPSTTDDDVAGYSVGSLWIDTTADNVYQAVDVTTSAAVWKHLNASGSGDLLADGSVPMTGEFDNADNAQIFTEITKPSDPSTSDWKLYFKTDGLYYLDDASAETGPLAPVSLNRAKVSDQGQHNVIAVDDNAVILTYDTEDIDVGGYIDLGSNNDRITIPTGQGGDYQVSARVSGEISTGTPTDFEVNLFLVKNSGNTLLAEAVMTVTDVGSSYFAMPINEPFTLSAADYLRLQFQIVSSTGSDEVTLDPAIMSILKAGA